MANSEWVDDPHSEEGWVDDHPHSSPLASGVRNFVHDASAGFSDELAGLAEGAGRTVGLKGAGGPMKDISVDMDGPTLDWEVLKDAYKRARDKERSTLKDDAKENPGASAIGSFAGMLASPVNKLAKGLSLAKGGAIVGGINALGNSDAEDVGGMAKDTAMGTGLGLLLGKTAEKAAPLVESGVSAIGNGARDLAKRFGARALGAERGTIKSLGQKKVLDAAGQALDEGVFSPLASTEDMINRNQAVKTKGGEMMGQAYDAIDSAGASTFNPLNAATEVENKIGNFYRSPINRGETNQLENTLESILMRGDGNIPLKEAQSLKEELNKVANWKNKLNITDKEKMARDAYGVVSRHIDDAVKAGGETIERAGLNDMLSGGKKLFSNASTADQLLENRAARESGNKIIGLTDAITGAGALGYGGVTGDWKTAGGLMLAKKGLEKYGSQNAALGLNKVSQFLLKSPKFAALAESNPRAFQAAAESIMNRVAPQALKKVAGPGDQPASEQDAKQSFLDGN